MVAFGDLFQSAWVSVLLDRELNSWRNTHVKERPHREQYKPTFLTFFSLASVFFSVKLILPNNESNRDHLFKAIHAFNFNLRCTAYQFKTKWKGKRNPQICFWRRASQIKQLKARGVVEEGILNVRNFLTITSTLLNADDDILGIVLHASCVSHFSLYVAEPTGHRQNVGELTTLPYAADRTTVHYGSRMDDHHHIPVHDSLRILVLAGVTFKPRYPDRIWCDWMHWRARFCLGALGFDHWYCCMFVGRLYWQRDVQIGRWAQPGSAEQRKWESDVRSCTPQPWTESNTVKIK